MSGKFAPWTLLPDDLCEALDEGDRSTPDCWDLETWADDVRAFCAALEIEAPIQTTLLP